MKEIFHRASIRKFEDKEVEEEKVKRLLEAAMSSPSAMNGRPWEFYVIRNKETLERLSKATPYSMCVKNANIAMVVCYQKDSIAEKFHDIDCAMATENVLLELDHLNLGGVMIGVSPDIDRMHEVEQILSLPENLHAFTIIPFGYPLAEKTQPNRYEEERVHYVD